MATTQSSIETDARIGAGIASDAPDGGGTAVPQVTEAVPGSLQADGDPVDPSAAQSPGVARPPLPELGGLVAGGEPRDLRLLADVTMRLSAEIGHASMQVQELIALAAGKIIELDRVAGSPVDILVNGSMVGRGEIMVHGDIIGVRLIEIVEQA